MDSAVAVVLAAGKSVRMQSDRPKVLHLVGGRPMVEYVLKSLRQAGIPRILLVIGRQGQMIQKAFQAHPGLEFVVQAQQRGTADAVLACRSALAQHAGPVVVLAGDQPLIRPRTIRALLDQFVKQQCACVVGTAIVSDPTGMGRILRDADGHFARIVEQTEADIEQLNIREVNVSCYVFDSRQLWPALEQIQPDNVKKEWYLTDCVAVLRQEGHKVLALPLVNPVEALGVNTPEQRAEADRLIQCLRDPTAEPSLNN